MTIQPCLFGRPLPSVGRARTEKAPLEPQLQDTIETSAAPNPPAAEGVKRSGMYCAACSCLSFMVGPVAHGVGKALKSLKLVPGASEPLPPDNPLGTQPASKLEVPLLLVHGWHTKIEFFHSLTDKLTEGGSNGGATGYLRNGQLFADPECTRPLDQPSPEMKVFLSVFTCSRKSPAATAPELQANIDAVRKLTGRPAVDIMGYSLGGLATQAHLDRSEDHGIRRFMMLGTPNQGAGLAGLSARALENERKGFDLRWLLDTKDIQPDDHDALEWLRPTSPLREDLHSRWEEQKAKVEAVLHVGAKSVLTPSRVLWPVGGDGTVSASSLELPGLEVRYVEPHGDYGQHKNLLANPDTYANMRQFFGWQ